MAAAKGPAPVAFKELLNLAQVGINAGSIKFANVNLAQRYVTVREDAALAIVDLGTKNVLRLPVKVDAANAHPVSKVLALRAGENLQIYNLEMRTRMKATQLAGVVFSRWIDTKTLAIVTTTAVYHWSMEGDSKPKKMFDRAAYNGQVQIINYGASADGKWLILGGIAAAPGGQGIAGVLQVYSVDLGASQPTMDAHAACFASLTVDGRQAPSNLFCFTQRGADGFKLNVIEIGVPRGQAFKQSAPMRLQGADFPVSMLASDKQGVVFVVTKAGFLLVHEVQSGKCIFSQQASRTTMFTSCQHEESGIITVDQNGRVSHFSIDEANVVPYICQQLQDFDLGVAMAKRYNLPGAENLFTQQFQRMMQGGRYHEAMQLAADSPQGVLRTLDTINQFKALNALPPAGQPQGPATSALLQYFSLLLKKERLNQVESIELARPVLQKNSPKGVKHIEDWLKENKLECSEELGDLLKNHDLNLALSVYLRAQVPDKVIGCFLALAAKAPTNEDAAQHFQKVFRYSQQANFKPDYPLLVQQLIRVNPDRAKDFGLLLIRSEQGSLIDIETLTQVFMQSNDVKNTTNILLEYLKTRGDREEDAALQTRLLEINLLSMPQVANAIMESDMYTLSHYDRLKVAQLCERAQLYQRALEHYSDLEDIKRVLNNAAQVLNPEFLLEYFGRMTPENCLECLRDLLKYNIQGNIRLVVEVSKKWSDYLTSAKLIQLFEEFDSFNGLYFYLGSFVNFTEDAEVVFKYIQAAVKLQQLREVERVCRDNDHYDAEQVKEFLLEQNLKDPRSLIHVCDRYDFVDELTQHLYSNQMFPFIEAYVQRMNSKATPKVVGALLDLNANEDQVRNLITNIRPPIDDPTFIERFVDEVEKRNRLKVLKEWLETRASENNEDAALHNGLAKIYVDTNNQPQNFLSNNKFYDSKVVGKYCESRDPHLAFIAYKRAWGQCDQELIEITNKHGFFKDQARYLVERQDLELWETVLVEENEFRRQLIDQVVATALPESTVPEEVSTTVKAFMAANLPNELIELLERIILHGPADGAFHRNKNLQNLLILTAIKADKQRVMDYINRLDNYDGPDIAKIAISDQYELYEEAFFIYKKFKKGAEAISVLLDNIQNIERAMEFADYWDQPDVWSLLGKAQLEQRMVKESIASYLKADDPSNYEDVIAAAKEEELFSELIEFIQMARARVREPLIDNEYIYAFARTDRLADLEDFIAGPNVAKLENVGDLCYQEGLYEAGRTLFAHIKNNAKLAMCLVKLGHFAEAVDSAKRANSIPTWKAVCYACVDAEKFRLAQMCGLNIVVYNDHLQELSLYYETRGHFEHVIVLLEQGVNLDRAHQGIFTQLGALYARYKEDKLMEHIRLFHSRLNIPNLLQECMLNQHWPETVYLYTRYDQNDNAVNTMMRHSTECWTNDLFKEVVGKVSNSEIFYRAIDFYLELHPLLLNDLLLELATKLDHARVVGQLRRVDRLALAKKYLLHVQRENVLAVNEAVNELFLEEEDYKSLRESVDTFPDFDQIDLAKRVEKHELVEFRRLAAYLFKLNGRFEKSIELSKGDELWGDAMETAASSKDNELAESLLRFFVENEQKECFGACLYTCYSLIRPDVVLELSWRFGLTDFAMPFMVQTFREYDDKISAVNRRLDEVSNKAAAKDEEEKKKEEEQARSGANLMGPMGAMGPAMIMPPPGPGGFAPGPGGYPPQGPPQGGFPPQGPPHGGYPPQQQQW